MAEFKKMWTEEEIEEAIKTPLEYTSVYKTLIGDETVGIDYVRQNQGPVDLFSIRLRNGSQTEEFQVFGGTQIHSNDLSKITANAIELLWNKTNPGYVPYITVGKSTNYGSMSSITIGGKDRILQIVFTESPGEACLRYSPSLPFDGVILDKGFSARDYWIKNHKIIEKDDGPVKFSSSDGYEFTSHPIQPVINYNGNLMTADDQIAGTITINVIPLVGPNGVKVGGSGTIAIDVTSSDLSGNSCTIEWTSSAPTEKFIGRVLENDMVWRDIHISGTTLTTNTALTVATSEGEVNLFNN